MVEAHGLYAPYFSEYLLDVATKYDAILVSPDYTLLPRKHGLQDVQDDIKAFHHWLISDFSKVLAEHSVEADLSKILLHGGSAGGYAALSQALAFPDAFKALSLLYPMLDFDTEWWHKGTKALGLPNPVKVPDEFFPTHEDLVKRIDEARNGQRVSYGGEDRVAFGVIIAQAGLFQDVFNPNGDLSDDKTVWLNRRVKDGAKLPGRIWVLHGDDDTAVPHETSLTFAETMEKQGRPVRLDIVKGVDHGFEGTASATWKGRQDPLITDGVSWLAESWLS